MHACHFVISCAIIDAVNGIQSVIGSPSQTYKETCIR